MLLRASRFTAHGLAFVKASLQTLKPGGLAVHTTELNLSSDNDTMKAGGTVLFRRRDLEGLIDELRAEGHFVEPLLIHSGSQPVDRFLDVTPYLDEPHLRLRIESFATTSIGLIIRK